MTSGAIRREARRAVGGVLRRPPVLTLVRRVRQVRFSESQYWERRYAAGGTSGAGSYGEIAAWKGEVVSEWVTRHQIASAVELGCGDGNQLLTCHYPRYLGLDVSASAVRRASTLFRDDATKSFASYDPTALADRAGWLRADAAVSLEVLFHLVHDEVRAAYLRLLFDLAQRYVVICSTDHDDVPGQGVHERHRRFTDWVADHAPDWDPIDRIDPPAGLPIASSFHLFARRSSPS